MACTYINRMLGFSRKMCGGKKDYVDHHSQIESMEGREKGYTTVE